jgi:hypothetical protein
MEMISYGGLAGKAKNAAWTWKISQTRGKRWEEEREKESGGEREREREREMKDRIFADAPQVSTPICSRVGLELLFVALMNLFRFWIMLSSPIVVWISCWACQCRWFPWDIRDWWEQNSRVWFPGNGGRRTTTRWCDPTIADANGCRRCIAEKDAKNTSFLHRNTSYYCTEIPLIAERFELCCRWWGSQCHVQFSAFLLSLSSIATLHKS